MWARICPPHSTNRSRFDCKNGMAATRSSSSRRRAPLSWPRRGPEGGEMTYAHQHLLGLEGLSRDEILYLVDTAASFKEISEREIKKVPTLRGKTVVSLFYEPST